MALNIGKCFNAALLPSIVLIIIAIIMQLIVDFAPSATTVWINGSPQLLVEMVILAWAGYRVVKEQGMDLFGGAVTGAIAGIISSFVSGIIHLLLVVLGISAGNINPTISGYGADMVSIIIMLAFVLAVALITILGAVEGAVGGVIGAFIAIMNSKK